MGGLLGKQKVEVKEPINSVHPLTPAGAGSPGAGQPDDNPFVDLEQQSDVNETDTIEEE